MRTGGIFQGLSAIGIPAFGTYDPTTGQDCCVGICCPDGMRCTEAGCLPGPAPGHQSACPSGCPQGTDCFTDGICRRSCSADSGCSAAEICIDGYCNPKAQGFTVDPSTWTQPAPPADTTPPSDTPPQTYAPPVDTAPPGNTPPQSYTPPKSALPIVQAAPGAASTVPVGMLVIGVLAIGGIVWFVSKDLKAKPNRRRLGRR